MSHTLCSLRTLRGFSRWLLNNNENIGKIVFSWLEFQFCSLVFDIYSYFGFNPNKRIHFHVCLTESYLNWKVIWHSKHGRQTLELCQGWIFARYWTNRGWMLFNKQTPDISTKMFLTRFQSNMHSQSPINLTNIVEILISKIYFTTKFFFEIYDQHINNWEENKFKPQKPINMLKHNV